MYRKRDELAPGDKFVRIAFSEASKEVDLAINQTIENLFSNNASKIHHSDLFRIVRFPSGPARGFLNKFINLIKTYFFFFK